jgi:hypothetical protein
VIQSCARPIICSSAIRSASAAASPAIAVMIAASGSTTMSRIRITLAAAASESRPFNQSLTFVCIGKKTMPSATAQKIGCRKPRTSQTKAIVTPMSSTPKKMRCAKLSFITGCLSLSFPPRESFAQ